MKTSAAFKEQLPAPVERPVVGPQPGPQTEFLASAADIAIYGGAAGGGKTFALLLEAMRHRTVRGFSSVIFRRNLVQVTNPGGLWDAATKLYPNAGARPKNNPLQWTFPSGMRVRFGHLDGEMTVLDWQGSEIPLLCFDELTHFSRAQFFYMLSRNRSMLGIRPYVRATCNPDADSWVAEFIAWWIDPITGLPIAERGGKLRWFVRINDALIWADTKEELEAKYPDQPPKSVTFIPATLKDNKALMEADPGYRANLMALPTVERERLMGGNWKIRPAAGLYFHRSWCELVDVIPAGVVFVRYWDLAATKKTEHNDPDWTVGLKMGRDQLGFYYIVDLVSARDNPGEIEALIKRTAVNDNKSVRIGLPKDPGQAGKAQAQYLIGQLAGFTVQAESETGDKVTRFGPFSSQSRGGNVRVLRAPWNEELFGALEGFPEAAHDDHADGCSGAFNMFQNSTGGLIEWYRRQMEKLHAQKPETTET